MICQTWTNNDSQAQLNLKQSQKLPFDHSEYSAPKIAYKYWFK